MAARLSEDPDVSVLLIERGATKDHLLSRIPLLSQNFIFKWTTGVTDRFSEPIGAYNGRRLMLVSADGLGGTSRVNGMLMTRGIPGGYEEWAETGTSNGLGLKGWGWTDVEPYFAKMETAVSHADKDYRGYKGPMSVKQVPLSYEFFPFIARACEAIGLPVEDDCNAPGASAQGYFRLDVAVNADGTRLSTNRAYLSNKVVLARRGRLTICTEAIAAKLQLSDDGSKVTGVHVQDTSAAAKNSPRTALAHVRREVIICGGAFRSPQLLMLSGIGPRDHLKCMGIPCVHNLPAVGKHLADHMAIPIMIDVPVRETAQRLMEEPWFGLRTFLQHLLFGSGFMSKPTNEVSIFARTSSLDPESYTVKKGEECMNASLPANIPDVEIMLNPCNCINLTAPPEEYAKSPTSGRAYLSFYTTLLQACVDGRMELVSATDPTAHTRIFYPTLGPDNGPNWQAMRRSVRLAMRLAKEFIEKSGYLYPAALTFAPGMSMETLMKVTRGRVGERPPVPVLAPAADPDTVAQEAVAAAASTESRATEAKEVPPPVTKTWKTVTDEEIDAYTRETCQSSLHFTSSCRMANSCEDGVVDTRLKVFGLSNLRIADASVLPKIPSAHTMAATLMVAERCADFVKEDWK